jgi:hypothetical protein
MVARRTSDGRFVLFTTTDVKPEWTLRRWGAVGDTGADGHGILARADALAAPSGWTTRQLMLVARRRLVAKGELCPLPATRDAVTALDQALACRWERGRPRARAACRCRSVKAIPHPAPVDRCDPGRPRHPPVPRSRGQGRHGRAAPDRARPAHARCRPRDPVPARPLALPPPRQGSALGRSPPAGRCPRLILPGLSQPEETPTCSAQRGRRQTRTRKEIPP